MRRELADSGNSGRSYRAGDRMLLMNIGMASCFSAIVILSLYVHSNEVMVLYRRPGLLLLLCPLILYWTCRIWLKAQRGELNEDPSPWPCAIRSAMAWPRPVWRSCCFPPSGFHCDFIHHGYPVRV